MEHNLILAIKPENYSTRISICHGNDLLFLKSINHNTDELDKFEEITDQHKFRSDRVIDELKKAEIEIDKISTVAFSKRREASAIITLIRDLHFNNLSTHITKKHCAKWAS